MGEPLCTVHGIFRYCFRMIACIMSDNITLIVVISSSLYAAAVAPEEHAAASVTSYMAPWWYYLTLMRTRPICISRETGARHLSSITSMKVKW